MIKGKDILGDIYDACRAQALDQLASYLPDDFCHVLCVPTEVFSLGGTRQGKRAAIERWNLIFQQFDFQLLDTKDLMIDRYHAAVEIPIHYVHRETGTLFKSTKANFWTLEDGWPVKLVEYYDIGQLQAFMNTLAAQRGKRVEVLTN